MKPHFTTFLCATFLVGCSLHRTTIIPFAFGEHGSASFPRERDILRWSRAEAYSATSALAGQPGNLGRLERGHDIAVLASEGYVLPLTANLRQYWTILFCLPSDIASGSEIPLSWSTESRLGPGHIRAAGYWGLTGLKAPEHGLAAGSVRVVSRSEHSLRLQLSLSIDLKSYEKGIRERGSLVRTLDLPIQKLDTQRLVYPAPKGSGEEVSTPTAGPMTKTTATTMGEQNECRQRSYAICRVINASRSPSPDPSR